MTSLLLAIAAGLAVGVHSGPTISSIAAQNPGESEEADGRVSISDKDPTYISAYGGARITVTGNDLVPTDYNKDDSNSETKAYIYRTDNMAGCPEVPCHVLTHFSSSTSIVCQIAAYEHPGHCLGETVWGSQSGGDYWRLKVVVNNVLSNDSSKFKLRRYPLIEHFAGTGLVTPATVGGFWTDWFNNDINIANDEHETFGTTLQASV